jgi:hypothetical protein
VGGINFYGYFWKRDSIPMRKFGYFLSCCHQMKLKKKKTLISDQTNSSDAKMAANKRSLVATFEKKNKLVAFFQGFN